MTNAYVAVISGWPERGFKLVCELYVRYWEVEAVLRMLQDGKILDELEGE